MDTIVITDIYSNKISRDKDINSLLSFIIINIKKPLFLLDKINYNNDTDSIWKINLQRMHAALHTHGINPNGFSLLGDLWFPTNQLPTNVQIPLVNVDNRLSQYPINFINIDQNIWKPIGQDGYQSLGLIYATIKPSLRSLRIVNKTYLIPYNKPEQIINKKTTMNEFNLLSIIGVEKYTIDRTKFLPKNQKINMKLSSQLNNKYITKNNNNITLADERNNDLDNSQNITYTGNGELQINNSCLELKNDGNILLENCNNSTNQKWYPYDQNYISYNKHECLTHNNSEIYGKDCDNSKSQKWTNFDASTIDDSIATWKTQEGKNVILTQPKSPWYIKKKKDINTTSKNNTEHNSYHDYADFESKFVLDPSRPDMGYGYSFAQRQGKPCQCLECKNNIEQFNTNNNDQIDSNNKFSLNTYIFALFFIIIALILIRRYTI